MKKTRRRVLKTKGPRSCTLHLPSSLLFLSSFKKLEKGKERKNEREGVQDLYAWSGLRSHLLFDQKKTDNGTEEPTWHAISLSSSLFFFKKKEVNKKKWEK